MLWITQRKRLLSQFNATFGDSLRSIRRTRTPLSVGIHSSWRQVAYAKAKAPDVVFAYSTAQNAFCCLVGAILNILCTRERRVFQSKLGVSSSNQCNLHHSPHTGHLGKKKNEKRVQSFSDTVYFTPLVCTNVMPRDNFPFLDFKLSPCCECCMFSSG